MAVRMTADLESNLISVERIKEYINLPAEADWTNPDFGNTDWPSKGKICFKNYSVKYRDELDFALKNIDCTIEPNEKVDFII
jgi:ATP-binding cassette subfamily C (CFTR/MRP) protein 1